MNIHKFIAELEHGLERLADQTPQEPVLLQVLTAVKWARVAATSGWSGKQVTIGKGHCRAGQHGVVIGDEYNGLLTVRVTHAVKPPVDVLVPVGMALTDDMPHHETASETIERLYARSRAAARQTPEDNNEQ